MKKYILTLLLIIVLLIMGCSSSANIEPYEVLVDVNQFSRISSEELIEKMGEPNRKEDWNNSTDRGNFLITIYYYDDYEFFIADDSVVRMNILSEQYNDINGDGIKFYSEESIFQMLNIPIDYNKIKKIADTGYALRYSPVSDKVAEVWC
ncbi:hypothetical protein, partial [Stenotrophomonas maltophilia group sp. RNC7]|uniref:hypothetical protein n=1 Tax=Stenotrophomonas maltophilia group sp. RNC7 TaxID=3071467 RepID=UPI0027E13A32